MVGDLVIVELQVGLWQPTSLRDAEDPDYVITATAHDITVRKRRNSPDGDCRMNYGLNTLAVCIWR